MDNLKEATEAVQRSRALRLFQVHRRNAWLRKIRDLVSGRNDEVSRQIQALYAEERIDIQIEDEDI